MRILVIGAGRIGAKAIRQLQKSPDIEVITADPRPKVFAVDEGIIEKVDIQESITPITIQPIIEEARPDMVLIAMQPEDLGLGESPGIDILADAIHDEIAALIPVPVIEVARTSR